MSRLFVVVRKILEAVAVEQADASKLKATITPSGDMARKAYYDRNASVVVKEFAGSIPAGQDEVQQWSYTVPSGKKAMHCILFHSAGMPIATSGREAVVTTKIHDGTAWRIITYCSQFSTTDLLKNQTVTATFLLDAGK